MGRTLVGIEGELMGKHRSLELAFPQEEVVRITVEGRPARPAENSMILIQSSHMGKKRARYLSWIGYHDLDEASAAEPGAWSLIEPATPYKAEVDWNPYN